MYKNPPFSLCLIIFICVYCNGIDFNLIKKYKKENILLN